MLEKFIFHDCSFCEFVKAYTQEIFMEWSFVQVFQHEIEKLPLFLVSLKFI